MIKRISQFKNNRLFIKMFIVMVISIISVSIMITYSTIRMSEKLFMETFSITNHKIIGHIGNNFESFGHSVFTVANQVQHSGTIKNFLTEKDRDALAMAKAYYDINQQMNSVSTAIDLYPVNIIITGKNSRSFSTNYFYWPVSADELRNAPITVNSYKQPSRLLYQYADKKDEEATIVATKALVEKSTNLIYGALYIAIRESDFKQMYANYTSDENDVMIVDSSGVIASSNREELIGHKEEKLFSMIQALEDRTGEYETVELFGKHYVLISEYLPTFDMYLVNLIDKESVMKGLIDKKAIISISSVIVFITLLIVFLISRKMTKSLTILVEQISNLAKYNFGQYVTVNGSYETKQLAVAFNDMLDELQEYVDKLIETEKKQRNAELEALQQQINPHFLYNTLTSIKILVQQGNKEKSADTIHALISLLQNTVGNISETITVEQELENMKNYVFINQIRYGDRIKVNYFVAADCLGYFLPKLIIQPFIENAFFHAFNKKQEGQIHILIAQEGESLICEVVDNGDGMVVNDEKFSRRSKHQLFSGIGVRNVHERVRLLYGERYGVDISSELGEGTRVKIKLPLLKK